MKEDRQLAQRVRNEIRRYILSHYSHFAKSELTFRHLKNHLTQVLDLDYAAFGDHEALGLVLDDEVEGITKRCDGGQKRPARSCVWPSNTTISSLQTPPMARILVACLVIALLNFIMRRCMRRRRRAAYR